MLLRAAASPVKPSAGSVTFQAPQHRADSLLCASTRSTGAISSQSAAVSSSGMTMPQQPAPLVLAAASGAAHQAILITPTLPPRPSTSSNKAAERRTTTEQLTQPTSSLPPDTSRKPWGRKRSSRPTSDSDAELDEYDTGCLVPIFDEPCPDSRPQAQALRNSVPRTGTRSSPSSTGGATAQQEATATPRRATTEDPVCRAVGSFLIASCTISAARHRPKSLTSSAFTYCMLRAAATFRCN